jgi:hypothetical protein
VDLAEREGALEGTGRRRRHDANAARLRRARDYRDPRPPEPEVASVTQKFGSVDAYTPKHLTEKVLTSKKFAERMEERSG